MAKTPTSTDVLVGSRVRFRRTEIGLTQQVLAEKLGVTFQQVQKYEKGTNRIGAGRLQEVSKALGVPITYFFQSLSGEEVAGEDQGSAAKIMRVSGASDLLRAYAQIENATIRRAVLDLVRKLAGAEDGVAETAPAAVAQGREARARHR
jgi:transcriptional regulator with XRE-family HTH domain